MTRETTMLLESVFPFVAFLAFAMTVAIGLGGLFYAINRENVLFYENGYCQHYVSVVGEQARVVTAKCEVKP